MKLTVEIDRLRLRAYHGVMPQEKQIGNIFEVSARVWWTTGRAVADDIADTVNYARMAELICREMAQSRNLIESVAQSIAEAITSQWPTVDGGMVKVTKLTPPMGLQMQGVSATVEW